MTNNRLPGFATVEAYRNSASAHHNWQAEDFVPAPDTMTVKIEIKSVYGELKAYPANKTADHFCLIAGTKTLTRNTLLNILAMGCTLIEVDRYGKDSVNHTSNRTFPVSIR